MKLLFIVNPIAGSGSALRAIPFIEEYCKQRNIEYEIIKLNLRATQLSWLVMLYLSSITVLLP